MIEVPQYPVNANYEKGLLEIINFANHLLSSANHAVLGLAQDCNVENETLQEICPNIYIKEFLHGKPSASTPSKREVWIQENLFKRSILFDKICEEGKGKDWQVEEGILIKFFLSFALLHEMAHVIVRVNLSDDEQQKANTSPVKFNVNYANYKVPESGWYLERLAFDGILSLLSVKNQRWNSTLSQKFIGVLIEDPEGLNLLNSSNIIEMWKRKKFTSIKNIISIRNYSIKSNEIATKQEPHPDSIEKKQEFQNFVLKDDEQIIRREYGKCYVGVLNRGENTKKNDNI